MQGYGYFMRLVAQATFVMAALAFPSPVPAQGTYPSGVIKLIVAAPAGGGTDQIARLIAASLQSQMKQTVVVEPRPGGSGILAAETVAPARPDGLTLLVTFDGHTISATKNKKLPYKVIDSFTPISQIVSSGILLSTQKSAPVKGLRELITWAKNYKGNLNIGAPGVNSPAFLAAHRFKQRTGIDAAVVNNRGSAGTLHGTLVQVVPIRVCKSAARAFHNLTEAYPAFSK